MKYEVRNALGHVSEHYTPDGAFAMARKLSRTGKPHTTKAGLAVTSVAFSGVLYEPLECKVCGGRGSKLTQTSTTGANGWGTWEDIECETCLGICWYKGEVMA